MKIDSKQLNKLFRQTLISSQAGHPFGENTVSRYSQQQHTNAHVTHPRLRFQDKLALSRMISGQSPAFKNLLHVVSLKKWTVYFRFL